MTAATAESQTVPEPPKLHQPKRAFVAAGEVVLGVLLVLVAVWCWQRGVEHHSYPVPDREPLEATRYRGNWIGTAVALVTATGVLLLDAVRQTVLSLRARHTPDPDDGIDAGMDDGIDGEIDGEIDGGAAPRQPADPHQGTNPDVQQVTKHDV